MTMYISTRGGAPSLSFTGAMMTGLAVDGGLYVPRTVPPLSADEMNLISGLSYPDAAAKVMAPLVGDAISGDDLVSMLRQSAAVFDHPDVAPLSTLEDSHFLLELYHGPTLAFKDVALQFLGHAFSHVLAQTGQRITIVGATSGDTGSAALAAFAGKPGVDIVILHPKGRVSDVQRRQMTTIDAPNVFNVAIEGDFDDCQNMVKAMFADDAFRDEVGLSAINSINWARIAAQVVYYVTTALAVRKKTGRAAAFVVPTGNFGNVYAGYIARQMGAPIDRLIFATNRNDILHRFLESGEMARHAVIPSLSPSMDIQVASNFERLLFDLFARDAEALSRTMARFATEGRFTLSAAQMDSVRAGFASGHCDDAQTLETIASVHADHGRIIDPHTAVGVHVARRWRQVHPDVPVVTLATAHPAKFPDAVARAIGAPPPIPSRLQGIMEKTERCVSLPVDLSRIKAYIRKKERGGDV